MIDEINSSAGRTAPPLCLSSLVARGVLPEAFPRRLVRDRASPGKLWPRLAMSCHCPVLPSLLSAADASLFSHTERQLAATIAFSSRSLHHYYPPQPAITTTAPLDACQPPSGDPQILHLPYPLRRQFPHSALRPLHPHHFSSRGPPQLMRANSLRRARLRQNEWCRDSIRDPFSVAGWGSNG